MSANLFSGAAVRVAQPIGEFWVASIPADILLQVTAPDTLRLVADPQHKHDDNEWRLAVRLLGNQRPLVESRLKKISNYIDSIESTFPNSIILAANTSEAADTGVDWRIEGAEGEQRLVIPTGARKAAVVDGQHRLYAFLRSSTAARKNFDLLCSVYFDLPEPMQALVFATINTNQTPVRRGLALNLYGYNVEDEERQFWSPEKVAVFMARRLNYDSESRLHMHVKIEAENAPHPVKLPGATRAIPMAAIVDGVLGLIAKDAKRDRDELRSTRRLTRNRRSKLATDDAPLREWYRRSEDGDIYRVVRGYLNIVYDRLWRSGAERSMLTRAVGVRALMAFLATLLDGAGDRSAAAKDGSDALLSYVEAQCSRAFARAARIDFSDIFFEASGRGQKRILNALMLASHFVELSNLPEGEQNEYARLL